MSCSLQTTSCTRLSTSGRAIRLGTGVTTPIQWLDRLGRQHRDLDDGPRRQLRDPGEALHHLPVGQHVRAADVEAAADLWRDRRGTDQVAQHVADRDRLDPGVQPARHDHRRQPLGQVAEHLEGHRAGPDDHRCLQDGGRDAAGEEDLADLPAGRQMRGELLLIRAEPAEVDDPADAGLARHAAENPRSAPVAPLEGRPRSRSRGSGSRPRPRPASRRRPGPRRRRRRRSPRRRRSTAARAAGPGAGPAPGPASRRSAAPGPAARRHSRWHR